MKKEPMVWSRLKDFRCPKKNCRQFLGTANTGTRAVGCEDEEGCGFWMRQEIFDRVVNSLYMAKPGYTPRFGDDPEMVTLIRSGEIPEGWEREVFLTPSDDEPV